LASIFTGLYRALKADTFLILLAHPRTPHVHTHANMRTCHTRTYVD